MKTFTRNVDRRSTYKCGWCGKLTRDTGYGEASLDMCKKCYVEGGLENQHNDNKGAAAAGFDSYGNEHLTTQTEAGITCPECIIEFKEA